MPVSQVDEARARHFAAQARYRSIVARLDDRLITAPFSGVLGFRQVSAGTLIKPGDPITTLDDISIIKLDFSVPETFITAVSVGMNIEAHSIVYPDRLFTGEVISVDTRLDPISRAVQVRAILPNADGALRPGMFLTVDLQRDRGEVLLVPEQAIVPEGSTQFVFVVKDGVVEKRRVEMGRRIPGFVVIRDGLAEGERVISEGTGKVREGANVEDIADADL